jgi:hypothetical protein
MGPVTREGNGKGKREKEKGKKGEREARPFDRVVPSNVEGRAKSRGASDGVRRLRGTQSPGLISCARHGVRNTHTPALHAVT